MLLATMLPYLFLSLYTHGLWVGVGLLVELWKLMWWLVHTVYQCVSGISIVYYCVCGIFDTLLDLFMALFVSHHFLSCLCPMDADLQTKAWA